MEIAGLENGVRMQQGFLGCLLVHDKSRVRFHPPAPAIETPEWEGRMSVSGSICKRGDKFPEKPVERLAKTSRISGSVRWKWKVTWRE